MGMDVLGIKPTTKEGEYFRNNVWSWRPLAIYIKFVAPEKLFNKCRNWQSNDGDGLDAVDSILLANVLQAEIDSGNTGKYQITYTSGLEQLPKEECPICQGTGTRKHPPMCGAGDPKTTGIKCNACDGEGFREPWAKAYAFSTENVQDFVTFLRGCGGFKIC
jgi:hypothetical protein